MGDLADAGVVVAEEHENRVVVVAARLGDLHQAADVEVQEAHGVVLRKAPGTGGLDRFQGQVLSLEAVVVLGNGERAVVAGGLQVGEERLVPGYGAQQAVAFLEQVEVGDAPDVHLGRLPVAFVVQTHVVDALADQAVDVGPAGVAADQVELVVLDIA